MARNVVFGFIIKGADATGSAWKRLRAGGVGALKGIARASDQTKKSIELVSQATTGLNQGMEIIRKGIEVGRLVVENTITKALEQRRWFDGQLADMRAYGLQIERIQGLIGDLLIPVVLGIADAMKPVLDSWEAYLGKNRELVGSGLIEWLQTQAKLLVGRVATAVVIATKAWSGLKLAIGFVKVAAQEAWQIILDGADVVAESFATVLRFLGKEELAKSFEATKNVTAAWREESEKAADSILADMAKEIAAQRELEDAVRDFEKAAKSGIDRVAVAAFRRLEQAIAKVPPRLKDVKEGARWLWAAGIWDQYASAVDAAFESALATENMVADNIIANEVRTVDDLTKLWEKYYRDREFMGRAAQRRVEVYLKENTARLGQEMSDSLRTQMESVADAVRGVWGEAFSDIGRLQNETVVEIVRNEEGLLEEQERVVAQHIKGLDDAFGQFFKGLATKALRSAQEYITAKAIEMAADKAAAIFGIQAAAAQGQASAIAAHSGIPFVGLAVGLAAAAAIAAAIFGLQKFHGGGTVPGTGEVPIMALGGEEVVKRAEAPAVRSFLADRRRGGGEGAPLGAGPGPVLHAEFKVFNLAPADRAETERQLADTLPALIQKWLDEGRIRWSPA